MGRRRLRDRDHRRDRDVLRAPRSPHAQSSVLVRRELGRGAHARALRAIAGAEIECPDRLRRAVEARSRLGPATRSTLGGRVLRGDGCRELRAGAFAVVEERGDRALRRGGGRARRDAHAALVAPQRSQAVHVRRVLRGAVAHPGRVGRSRPRPQAARVARGGRRAHAALQLDGAVRSGRGVRRSVHIGDARRCEMASVRHPRRGRCRRDRARRVLLGRDGSDAQLQAPRATGLSTICMAHRSRWCETPGTGWSPSHPTSRCRPRSFLRSSCAASWCWFAFVRARSRSRFRSSGSRWRSSGASSGTRSWISAPRTSCWSRRWSSSCSARSGSWGRSGAGYARPEPWSAPTV